MSAIINGCKSRSDIIARHVYTWKISCQLSYYYMTVIYKIVSWLEEEDLDGSIVLVTLGHSTSLIYQVVHIFGCLFL